MKDILVSIYMWSFMLGVTIAIIPWSFFALLVFPVFDPHRKQFLLIHRVWCNSVAKAFPKWKYIHRGLEKLKPGQHYVVMSNHQSLGDILLLSFLPIIFRWTTKRSVFYVPLFGWQFWLGGHLSIVRGSEKSRKQFMKKAVRSLQDGISVLIFPEGTRSVMGEMGPFRPGGFVMAVKTGAPILPIVIGGSLKALPKNSWIMRDLTCPVIQVLDPIETAGKTEGDLDALMKEVRDRMVEAKKGADEESARLLREWAGGNA